jgi:hypothetical protein
MHMMGRLTTDRPKVGAGMPFVHFLSLNWLILYVAVVGTTVSVWRYQKKKETIPLLSMSAWVLVATLCALGIRTLE